MKKAFKITWISLASVLGLIIITVLIALYLVLTPKRLTSLVNKYASKFITCDYNIGKVDLTVFKTFPDVGLEINDLVLINPTKGWTTDTLAAINECMVSANIKKILFENEIIVNSCTLNGGFVNAFFDKEGNSNFDIFPPSDTTNQEQDTDSTSYLIDINKLILNDIDLRYTDLASNIAAAVNGLDLNAKANMKDDDIVGDINLKINDITAKIDDTTSIDAAIKDFAVNGKIKMTGDDIKANAVFGTGLIAFLMTGDGDIAADLNSFNFSYDGDINDYELIKGIVDLKANGTTMALDNEKYIDKANISLNTPLELNINSLNASFEKSELRFNDIIIGFLGQFAMNDPEIKMNMDVNTNTLDIGNVINLIPQSMREEMLEGISADGKLKLKSHIAGTYSEKSMPLINADITLDNGYVAMQDMLPYPLTDVNTVLHTDLNLNGKSDVYVKSLNATMNRTSVTASGNINDVLDKMLCDMNVKADVNFDDVKSFMPEELLAKGRVKADVNLRGTADQFSNLDLMNTKLNGKLICKNLNIKYADTINLKSSDMNVDFILPNPSGNFLKNGLAQVQLSGSDIDADITGMMKAMLNDFDISAQVSNVLDTTAAMATVADFSFSNLDFTMDDMVLRSNNASGSAMMLPSTNEGNTSYAAVYSSDSLIFGMGDEMNFATEVLSLDVMADYDEKEEDVILQWKPNLGLNLSNAVFKMKDLSEDVIIPDIDLDYGESGLHIENSQITLGNSDFMLDGNLTNFYEHYKNNDLLVGVFNFTSNYTDVNQLMDIFNGMGSDEAAVEQEEADTTAVEDDPFMVPLGVDIKLHTLIKSATAGAMQIRNVGGDLTVKDGILVLEEMGFTSDAAKMQLTALYKSKRKNHLYTGLDFHLLDIDIAEMIRIIPDLDTIVPMLKSFAGKAEFHFAAETNLKSDYSLKYSTLKAACSIEGQDLVVLDSETFDMIKKKLFFSKKTDNKIDSLDVQFTVFKNEIDVYPFSVSMDKYSAMLYGRHNLDMSYDYNIAVLSPRFLSRLGLEIKGPDFDNMKFKVRANRHRNMFKPEKRDYKEEKVAEIKKIIANSLKDNVKPQ